MKHRTKRSTHLRATRAMLATVLMLCATMWASVANATVVKLYYNPLNAPNCCTDNAQVIRVILQAAREFEAHSYGAIQFDWKGITNVVLDGSDNQTVQIGWHLDLINGSTCGQAGEPNTGQYSGRIWMDPGRTWRMNSSTFPSWQHRQCQDLRSNIMHEMDHFFRPGLNDHPVDSVLIDNWVWADLFSRNLWNDDIAGITTLYFPRRPVALVVDTLALNESQVYRGGIVFPAGANHTGALGPGGPAHMYSRVFTDHDAGVWLEQGDGDGGAWTANRQIGSGTHPTTFHRACIATNTVNFDMVVAWASSVQRSAYWGNGFDPTSGSREIVFAESHDGGASWTAPVAIPALITPTARTRTGVSCAFDLVNMRFVLVYASEQEVLNITSRLTGNAAAWTLPQIVSSAGSPQLRTGEAPVLSFDPMDWNNSGGMLGWWDSDDNDQRSMSIQWSAGQGQYVSSSGDLTDIVASGAEEEVLRTSIVFSLNAGVAHWAFGTQANDVQGRWRRRLPDGFTSADFFNNSWAQYFGWYVGASANRQSFTEKSYLSHLAIF